MTSSYRESDRPIRYICIVCYRTVSSVEGTCGNCLRAPLQLIEGNDEIIEELRRRAKAKKGRPLKRQVAFISSISFALALVTHAFLLAYNVYDVNPNDGGWGSGSGSAILGVYVLFTFFGFFIILSYFTDWLGLFKPPPGSESFDPASASIPALLDWLNLREKSTR